MRRLPLPLPLFLPIPRQPVWENPVISRLVPDTWQTVLQSDCPLFFFSSLSPARSENLTLQSLRALPRCQDTPENTPRRRNRSAHTEPLHRFPQAVQPEDSAPGPSRSPLLPQRKIFQCPFMISPVCPELFFFPATGTLTRSFLLLP